MNRMSVLQTVSKPPLRWRRTSVLPARARVGGPASRWFDRAKALCHRMRLARWAVLKPLLALTAALTLGVSVPARTQGKPNFSGKWIYNQALSNPGTFGNNPLVPFPSELVIKQTPGELHWQGSTVRQDAIAAIFKLDGSEVTMAGAPEMTMRGKAMLEGDKLVITSKRSYSSPAGDIITDVNEVYSLAGDVLTVEKTQTTGGISSTLKAVYNKTAS